jgi:hypothetical protein
MKCNTLLYAFPTAMAKALAGDPSMLPTHIGFIYGDSGSSEATFTWTPGDRDVTWSSIADEIAVSGEGAKFNMQISRLDYTPSLSTVALGEAANSSNNAVSFTGITESGSEGVTLAFAGAQYETAEGIAENSTIYQAVLLAKTGESSYTALARVDLKDGTYPVKSSDAREFSVFWRIAFF